jgi:outer membrane protein insertion porin family
MAAQSVLCQSLYALNKDTLAHALLAIPYRYMHRLLILALVWSGVAAAQGSKKWPIERLEVEGNQNYSAEQILAVSGLAIGQMAGQAEFEAAQQRLETTGLFETVGYKFGPSAGSNGYAATFQVLEVEPVYPVRFADLGVPDADATQWLKARNPLFGGKLPATRAVLDRFARSLQELAAGRNLQEKVIAKLEPVGGDQFIIVFRPNRPEAAVAEIDFEGNQVVPINVLRDAISGVAVGAAYSEPSFRELLKNAVKPVYDARGRIRVAFPKISTEKAKDVEGIVVHVTVEEGPSFELGEVKLENKSDVKTEDLLKAGNFKKGDLANFDEINQGVERIRKRLRRDGYMRVNATVDRAIHDEKKNVDLVVRIDEGARFTFGKLAVQGLDLEGEPAIRKLWAMKEGKPFNPEYPDYFLGQVKERGLFDNLGDAKASVNVNEKTRTVDVTLNFRGPSTVPGATSPGEPRRPGP